MDPADADPDPDSSDEALVRELARTGALAARLREAAPDLRRRLMSAVYGIAWPVVFHRVTAPVERRRGHWACATALPRLTDECLDRFHNDVEAVVADLLANAGTPIRNLEAWLAPRLTAVTIDGHRRRRGRLGALQRPRVPVWLATALGRDAWLMELAVEILNWVGVSATAGTGTWPLESWALRRAAVTGDPAGSESGAVLADVERVLGAMRQRPRWYADYVERPLGRKAAPVSAPPGDGAGDPRPLVPVPAYEIDEARLSALAATAVEAIAAALQRGADPSEAVVGVLTTVFREGPGGDDLGLIPGTAAELDERVSTLLGDPGTVERVVGVALRIVADLEG